MRKFLLHFIGYLLFLSVIFYLITFITDKGLRKTGYSAYMVWNDLRNGAINADVLIQGSSHAWVQIDPRMLDTMFHTNSYNIGMDAYAFNVQYARYKMYRQYNKKPKLIIQVLDYFVFSKSTSLFDGSQFLPYLSNSYINNEVTQLGMPAYYRYMPFLKYQENADCVQKGFAEYFNIKHWPAETYKGFKGNDTKWDESKFEDFKQTTKYIYPELSSEVLDSAYSFLKSCRQENIKVAFVFTPHYYQFTRVMVFGKRYRQFLKSIADKYGAVYIDFSNDPMCSDTKYYYNGTHLNKTGAEVFSAKLGQKIAEQYPVLFQ